MFLLLDMVLFAAFTFLTLLRYYLSPRIFVAMLHHETHSLFLGTIRAPFPRLLCDMQPAERN